MSALIHFNMATFFHDGDPGCSGQNWRGCDSNGGNCNSSNPASFAPSNLNVSNWVDSFKALGPDFTHAVLTAKHGCGFLLWPTAQTLPDGSPYYYNVPADLDVLATFSETLRAASIGVGFYYSLTNSFVLNTFGHVTKPPSTLYPGMANVTQAQYESLSLALLQELWSSFGPLDEIWLDGGCGPQEMCDRVAALIAAEPNAKDAIVFNGGGGVSPNAVRWCGTESGVPGGLPTVWSTAACNPAWCQSGSGRGNPPNATNASWYPSAVDATIQVNDHWFYTPGDGVYNLSKYASYYHSSIGANGHLELDFAIDRTGGVNDTHAAAYALFGQWITACYYKAPLANGTLAPGAPNATIPLPPASTLDRIVLAEEQAGGQFVVDYATEVLLANGTWVPFSSGTTIGSKRIDRETPVTGATALRIAILSAFAPGHQGVNITALGPEGCSGF